jgi:Rps23 Pro-64 3,4-dihydroxylase Tpa1-like proline 4-hydroxylase
MEVERESLASAICDRLDAQQDTLCRQWRESGPVRHFILDDVLPEPWVTRLRAAFPSKDAMTIRRSLRELKYVAAQMDRYDPQIEESVYAFQMPNVVERIGRITGLEALEPDNNLYAGGISVMAPGHFLNPHIDNSHDKFRQRYRMLNLLFYVSPDWPADRGGNLELCRTGPPMVPRQSSANSTGLWLCSHIAILGTPYPKTALPPIAAAYRTITSPSRGLRVLITTM